MTVFEKADKEGRDAFKAFCSTQSWCKVHKEGKNEFSHWDVSYFSGSTKVIGEIKQRYYDSTRFSDWDYELMKHNDLKEVQKQTNVKYPDEHFEIQYINIYQDGAIRIWTTTSIENEQPTVDAERKKKQLGDQSIITKKIFNCYNSTAVLTSKI